MRTPRRVCTGPASFVLLLALASFAFLPRIWAIRVLFTERAAASAAITRAAEREGWLVSDLEVTAADTASLTVLHRRHLRGPDPVTCHVLRLSDAALLPCDAG